MKYYGNLKTKMQDAGFRRLVAQERFLAQAQEEISQLMEKRNVSRAELARRLGKTRGFVTQLLNSGRNLTLRTIADVFSALGEQPAILAKTEVAASQSKVTSRPSERRETWKTTIQTSRVRSGYTPMEEYERGLLRTCTIIQHAQM